MPGFCDYEHLSDRAVSKNANPRIQRDAMISLIMRTTVCGVSLLMILRVMRIQTVTATRMINVKYAVRKRDHIECAETGSDQHCDRKNDSDCLHKNAPSDEYIFVYRYYTTILIKWKTFLLISLRKFRIMKR